MTFPPDNERREYASYYIKAVKIFKVVFKQLNRREPTELEIGDFSKMGVIPFEYIPRGNDQQRSSQDQPQSNSNPAKSENKPSSSERPKNQPS